MAPSSTVQRSKLHGMGTPRMTPAAHSRPALALGTCTRQPSVPSRNLHGSCTPSQPPPPSAARLNVTPPRIRPCQTLPVAHSSMTPMTPPPPSAPPRSRMRCPTTPPLAGSCRTPRGIQSGTPPVASWSMTPRMPQPPAVVCSSMRPQTPPPVSVSNLGLSRPVVNSDFAMQHGSRSMRLAHSPPPVHSRAAQPRVPHGSVVRQTSCPSLNYRPPPNQSDRIVHGGPMRSVVYPPQTAHPTLAKSQRIVPQTVPSLPASFLSHGARQAVTIQSGTCADDRHRGKKTLDASQTRGHIKASSHTAASAGREFKQVVSAVHAAFHIHDLHMARAWTRTASHGPPKISPCVELSARRVLLLENTQQHNTRSFSLQPMAVNSQHGYVQHSVPAVTAVTSSFQLPGGMELTRPRLGFSTEKPGHTHSTSTRNLTFQLVPDSISASDRHALQRLPCSHPRVASSMRSCSALPEESASHALGSLRGLSNMPALPTCSAAAATGLGTLATHFLPQIGIEMEAGSAISATARKTDVFSSSMSISFRASCSLESSIPQVDEQKALPSPQGCADLTSTILSTCSPPSKANKVAGDAHVTFMQLVGPVAGDEWMPVEGSPGQAECTSLPLQLPMPASPCDLERKGDVCEGSKHSIPRSVALHPGDHDMDSVCAPASSPEKFSKLNIAICTFVPDRAKQFLSSCHQVSPQTVVFVQEDSYSVVMDSNVERRKWLADSVVPGASQGCALTDFKKYSPQNQDAAARKIQRKATAWLAKQSVATSLPEPAWDVEDSLTSTRDWNRENTDCSTSTIATLSHQPRTKTRLQAQQLQSSEAESTTFLDKHAEEAEQCAALAIQCVVRGCMARRLVHERCLKAQQFQSSEAESTTSANENTREVEKCAALAIQRMARGCMARRLVHKRSLQAQQLQSSEAKNTTLADETAGEAENCAALAIQRVARGCMTRKLVHKRCLQAQHLQSSEAESTTLADKNAREDEQYAALAIQRVARGCMVRRRVHKHCLCAQHLRSSEADRTTFADKKAGEAEQCAALAIQCVARGCMAQRVVHERWLQTQQLQSSEAESANFAEKNAREAEHCAALAIQCVARCCMARWLVQKRCGAINRWTRQRYASAFQTLGINSASVSVNYSWYGTSVMIKCHSFTASAPDWYVTKSVRQFVCLSRQLTLLGMHDIGIEFPAISCWELCGLPMRRTAMERRQEALCNWFEAALCASSRAPKPAQDTIRQFTSTPTGSYFIAFLMRAFSLKQSANDVPFPKGINATNSAKGSQLFLAKGRAARHRRFVKKTIQPVEICTGQIESCLGG